jgi:hypothetical protein
VGSRWGWVSFSGLQDRTWLSCEVVMCTVTSPQELVLWTRIGSCYDKVTETTQLFSLVSLFWKDLGAHCFHYFLTVL